jgi:hypothetical protein
LGPRHSCAGGGEGTTSSILSNQTEMRAPAVDPPAVRVVLVLLPALLGTLTRFRLGPPLIVCPSALLCSAVLCCVQTVCSPLDPIAPSRLYVKNPMPPPDPPLEQKGRYGRTTGRHAAPSPSGTIAVPWGHPQGASEYVLGTLRLCSGYVPGMPRVCPEYVPGMPRVRPRYAPSMSRLRPGYAPGVCPGYVPATPQVCPGYVPGMSRVCPEYTPSIPRVYPEYTPGMSRVCPEYTPSIPRVYPWYIPSRVRSGYTPGMSRPGCSGYTPGMSRPGYAPGIPRVLRVYPRYVPSRVRSGYTPGAPGIPRVRSACLRGTTYRFQKTVISPPRTPPLEQKGRYSRHTGVPNSAPSPLGTIAVPWGYPGGGVPSIQGKSRSQGKMPGQKSGMFRDCGRCPPAVRQSCRRLKDDGSVFSVFFSLVYENKK